MPERNQSGSAVKALPLKGRIKITKAKLYQARKVLLITLTTALLLLGVGVSKYAQGQTVEALAFILPTIAGSLIVVIVSTLAWRCSTTETLKLKLHIAVHDPDAKLIFEALLNQSQREVAYAFLKEEADMRVIDLLEIAREIA